MIVAFSFFFLIPVYEWKKILIEQLVHLYPKIAWNCVAVINSSIVNTVTPDTDCIDCCWAVTVNPDWAIQLGYSGRGDQCYDECEFAYSHFIWMEIS